MDEIKTAKVDGVVVTIPKDEKAYLIVEHPIKGRVVEPLEKVPLEERIAELGKKIAEAFKEKEGVTKKKKKEVV